MEKVEARLKQDFTFYYFICIGQQKAGAIRMLTKRKTEKTKEFPQYLYCWNFKGKALHRKQSGCVKKCMETKIGSCIVSSNSKKIIYAPCDVKPFPKSKKFQGADVLIIGNTIVGDIIKDGFVLNENNPLGKELFTLDEIDSMLHK